MSRYIVQGRTAGGTTLITACLAFAMLLVSGPAAAQMHWVQESAGGCATSIAVGPTNVPWVIGCGSAPDKGVFYLKRGKGCGGLVCPDSWAYDNGAGTNVSSDLHGHANVVTSGGEVYNDLGETAGIGQPWLPRGTWDEQSPIATGYWATMYASPGWGCLRQVATTVSPGLLEVMFEPSSTNRLYIGDVGPTYGIGCGPYRDEGIWVLNPANGVTSWAQVDAQDGAAASQIALFTQSPPTGYIQTLWALNSQGGLWSYNGVGFVREPAPDGFVYAITDHFVAAYQYSPAGPTASAAISQWNDNTQSWVPYISLFTPNGTQIEQIAHSAAFYSEDGLIGPSWLWGIDNYGGIYFAAPAGQNQ
jgi:hypothetical protein